MSIYLIWILFLLKTRLMLKTTQVPKRQSIETINDFRPISLLNGPLKILTKIMANELQKVITKLVSSNQYGFMRQKSIHDCLAWAFQYIHICHAAKREV